MNILNYLKNIKINHLDENLLELALKINNNVELEPIQNLLLLMNDYNSCITSLSK